MLRVSQDPIYCFQPSLYAAFPPWYADSSGHASKSNWVTLLFLPKNCILWSVPTQHLSWFGLDLLHDPNGSKRVPQKECVYSDSPVSYKQRYERGNCQVLVQKREMQIQKAADVGPGQLLCFLSQEQCICKMGIRLIPQPKYQPNRGRSLMKEQGNIFKTLASHQRAKVSSHGLFHRHP